MQNGDHLCRLQDRNRAHCSADGDVLNANELRFQHGLAILQENFYNFLEITRQFVKVAP
jgi:hypothetical protein